MLRNRIYYSLKPFVPRLLRTAVRRRFALRLKGQGLSDWPIKPGSQRKPDGWKGWPGGKRFAFVLTHDVEGSLGLKNCQRLAALEREMGFRSCFNFIPEGAYRVSSALRHELTDAGFEVGVHDLRHDGRLYRSRRDFQRRAARINHYLREWEASGFRSGFMLHNLDWLHDLEIEYDMSTFDTDPFEPQPEGHHTIFPFWVARPPLLDGEGLTASKAKRGYVELPYTLAQDSTLFLLLREESAKIWMAKLDWIAEHGGMALVNIHPDYVRFDGQKRRTSQYPVARLREFLEYVSGKYHALFWNPSPRELAHWFHENHPNSAVAAGKSGEASPPCQPSSLRGKRAAVLLYSYYPADPRPRRAAEALVASGMEVDLICLRENEAEPKKETIAGVKISRLPLRKQRRSKLTYLRKYTAFLLACFGILAIRSFRRRYDLVHVHNMPDVLVFSALIPRLLGARIILDLHDPMPELMLSIYHLPPTHRLVRLLRKLEQASVAFAHLILTPNRAFRDLFMTRGCPPEKIQIIMNSPQEEIFDATKFSSSGSSNGERPFKLMYHGLIAERHGLDTALHSAALLRDRIPNLEFHIFGSRTSYMNQIDVLVRDLGLGGCVRYHGHQPQSRIAQAIRESDLGLIPNRRSSFTEINMPTRIFEYAAMERPVVVPDTRGIRDYFGNDSALFFEPGNAESLAAVIETVYRDPHHVSTIISRSRHIYEQHRWTIQKTRFVQMVSLLLSPGGARYFRRT